jgi:excisionase family DNA binding protein
MTLDWFGTQAGVEADCFQLLRGVRVNTQLMEADALLTPAEVAAILYVDPKTVTRWAISGKINSIRTPGGHRRFLKSEILGLMTGVNHSQNRGPWPSSGYAAAASTSFATDPRGILHHGRPDGTATEADRYAAAAAAVVAEAVAIAREAQADDAARAVILTGDAVVAAAGRATEAAETARAGRASAAADAAEAVANNAARTAAAIQRRADASAIRLAEAAARAAAIVAAANPPASDHEAALTALQLAATVEALAVATAEDTAAAAARVASAVTAAAAEVAFTVSALDIAIESEVAEVAAALQTTATATARQVAADTDARASGVAMVARGAAAAARSLDMYGESTTPQVPATAAHAHAFGSDTRR